MDSHFITENAYNNSLKKLYEEEDKYRNSILIITPGRIKPASDNF